MADALAILSATVTGADCPHVLCDLDGSGSVATRDAYVALERYADAADAYALALSDGQRLATVDRSLLRWKIIDLPDVPATIEAAVEEGEGLQGGVDDVATDADEAGQ